VVYWLLGRFFTRRPRLMSVATMAREEPILELSRRDGGFEYSDAYLHDNDARFVWGFVRERPRSRRRAANYVESSARAREGEVSGSSRARDVLTGRELTIRAKVLVNACGPFVDAHNARTGVTTSHHHVFSKGIHLIVPRLTQEKRVLTFFADDGRLFFVIPMGPRTCVGTTDTRVEEPETHVTPEDRRFVLDNINKRLRLDKPLTESRRDRRALRRASARDREAAEGKERLDAALPQARDRGRRDRAHVSIFGGKLTDCLNVGQEVYDEVVRLGVTPPYPRRRWYGEPEEAREEFFYQAELMDLDALTSPRSSEKLTTRLWRRYGRDALILLETIRRDPREAEVLIAGAEYLRCEIEKAARREMVTKLEDFLRRRSKIALVIPEDEIKDAPGLREACLLMFGDEADAKIEEYFADEAAKRSQHAGVTGVTGVTEPGTAA
jgi:glycerol-3-phosphate dehydrogenase